MKKNLIFTFLLLLLIIPFQKSYTAKRALIIAVGKYPTQSGWGNLSSTNDAQLLQTTLLKQGFSSANITIVSDQNATKAGIANAFNKLTTLSQAGDVVVFHFSGHGQQVTDANGDEADGLDEALIAYDAPKINATKATAARFHLLDDELNIYLTNLRKKVGSSGDVLFFIDACHSGTSTRASSSDSAIYRGTSEVFNLPIAIAAKSSVDDSPYSEPTSSTRGNNTALSPYIILSACLANQLNKEYRNYGSLSYAVCKVLSSNQFNQSYVSFFDAVRTEMLPLMISSTGRTHDQTPQIEGNMERKLFAGKAIEIPAHSKVEKVKGQTVLLNIGSLAGVFAGAEVKLYPPDTYKPSGTKPLAICMVDSADLIQCAVTLPTNVDKKLVQNAWAFVSKYRYRTNSAESIDQMRARVMRSASTRQSEVTFEIVPLNAKSEAIPVVQKTINGNITFNFGNRFMLKVSNNSKEDIYFQLIDIMPTDEIGIVMGRSNENRTDYFLKAGESKAFAKDILTIDAGSPLGMETLVLVATPKPIDLSALETKVPNAKRSEDSNEFETWINSLYNNDRAVSVFDRTNVYIHRNSFIVKSK